MKKLMVFLCTLLLLLPVAAAAQGRTPMIEPLPGCSYVEWGGFVTFTEDTLWFTDAMSAAPAGFDGGATEVIDWHPAKEIPIGTRNGVLKKDKRRVRALLVYARLPFDVQVFQNGEATAMGAAYVNVDSTGLNPRFAPEIYPFQLLVDWPDSAHVANAADADSVQYLLGYQ